VYRIGQEEADAVARVIEAKKLFRVGDPQSGHLQQVVTFEKEWADTIGTEHALCVSGGGTAAILCGLAALEIGPGDEVIVPAYTWMATATCVLAAGAIPVFADIDETMTIDPEDVLAKITPQTKAIIPVHLVGRPCNMQRLIEIAQQHDIKILEDCCQADGGSYLGRRVGSWGDIGAFSFNEFKIISCGDGGALVTNDNRLYERASIYHDSGTAFRPNVTEIEEPIFIGHQFRATEIMGAILRVQLERLDGILADLRAGRHKYIEALDGKYGLKVAPSNDTEGDCGIAVAFQFDTEEEARAFATAPGVEGSLPIDSGKHIYTNWTPIFEKRIGHHPDVNPFNHPKNLGLRQNYTADMCQRTLDLLARTVYLSIDPNAPEGFDEGRIAACIQAQTLTAAAV
jgi:dTDP-4-amino-4,6-dideoxygalactose transaminase